MTLDWKDKILGGLADAPPAPVASMRHLRRLILIVIGIAAVTFVQARPVTAVPIVSRIPLYLVLIGVEILLVRFVAIGIRACDYQLLDLFGRHWRSLFDGFCDVLLAITTMALLPLSTRVIYFFLGHWSSNTGFLLPATVTESLLWIVVALTAGVCEELVYRGYLQRQLWSLTKSSTSAILLQAAIFGSAHIYQGWKPAIVTAIYGAVFGLLAAWRRSIIPGMIAHSAIDLIGGLFSR